MFVIIIINNLGFIVIYLLVLIEFSLAQYLYTLKKFMLRSAFMKIEKQFPFIMQCLHNALKDAEARIGITY